MDSEEQNAPKTGTIGNLDKCSYSTLIKYDLNRHDWMEFEMTTPQKGQRAYVCIYCGASKRTYI